MQAHMALTARTQKPVGFLQALFFGAITVPVRYFITQQMGYADAVKGVGDGFQRIFNRKWRGMMVNNKCHAVFGTIQR